MVRFELKKIFNSKKMWLTIATFFILSISLLQLELNFSKDPRISHSSLFKLIISEVDDVQLEIELYSQYAQMQKVEFEGYDLNNYNQDFVSDYQKIVKDYGEDYIQRRLKVLHFISNEAYHLDYADYNKDVLASLESLNQSNQLVLRMKDYYKDLSLITVERSDSLVLDALYSQKTFNIGVILMLIIIITLLSNVDNQAEMDSIISLSKTGKFKVLFWKYITGLIFSFIFMFLLFIINLIILNYRFGFVPLDTPIQAFYSYFSSPFSLDIISFIIRILFSNMLFVIMLYSLLWIVSLFFNNSQIGVIIVLFTYLLSMLLSVLIPNDSALETLKHFNIYAFGLVAQSMGNFLSFTILGISKVLPHLINIALIVFAGIFIFLLIIISRYDISLKINVKKFKIRFKHFFEKTSHSFHERFKLLIMEYNYLFTTLIFISMVSFLLINANTKQSVYNKDLSNYINNNGGLITDDLIDFYEEEKIKYDNFEMNYQEEMDKVISGEIDRRQFDEMFPKFESLKWESHIFKGAYGRLHQLPRYHMDTTGIDILISQYSFVNDYIIAFIIIVGSIIVYSNVMSIDKRNQELDIYLLTESGIKEMYWHKYKILVQSICTIMIFILIYTILIFNKYSISLFGATVFDIANDNILPKLLLDNYLIMNMKLSHYLILINVIRLIGIYFVLISIFTLSKYFKSRSTVFIIALFVFVVSSVLFLSGFSFFNIFNVFDLIAGNIYFWTHVSLAKVLMILIFNIILTFVFLNVTK